MELDGEYVSVRLIGMNTPETVKPGSPVECFGPESSEFAKAALTGEPVTLEFDDSQGMTDQYDRTLAYVWRELPDGSLQPVQPRVDRRRLRVRAPVRVDAVCVEGRVRGSPARRRRTLDAGLWGACPYS